MTVTYEEWTWNDKGGKCYTNSIITTKVHFDDDNNRIWCTTIDHGTIIIDFDCIISIED